MGSEYQKPSTSYSGLTSYLLTQTFFFSFFFFFYQIPSLLPVFFFFLIDRRIINLNSFIF